MRVADLRFEPDLRECDRCPPTGCDLRCVLEREPLDGRGTE